MTRDTPGPDLALSAAACDSVKWLQPSGPRILGEGIEDQEQGIMEATPTQNGGAVLRITLLAAGFVIGPNGVCVREVSRQSGADIKSWTDKQKASLDNKHRPCRNFLVQGAQQEVVLALDIICDAVDCYKALCEGRYSGQYVSKAQKVHNMEFYYQPPPRNIVPHAAALKGQQPWVPGHFSSSGQSAQAASIFAQVKQTIAAQRQAFSHNTSSNMEHQVDSGLQHADLLLAQAIASEWHGRANPAAAPPPLPAASLHLPTPHSVLQQQGSSQRHSSLRQSGHQSRPEPHSHPPQSVTGDLSGARTQDFGTSTGSMLSLHSDESNLPAADNFWKQQSSLGAITHDRTDTSVWHSSGQGVQYGVQPGNLGTAAEARLQALTMHQKRQTHLASHSYGCSADALPFVPGQVHASALHQAAVQWPGQGLGQSPVHSFWASHSLLSGSQNSDASAAVRFDEPAGVMLNRVNSHLNPMNAGLARCEANQRGHPSSFGILLPPLASGPLRDISTGLNMPAYNSMASNEQCCSHSIGPQAVPLLASASQPELWYQAAPSSFGAAAQSCAWYGRQAATAESSGMMLGNGEGGALGGTRRHCDAYAASHMVGSMQHAVQQAQNSSPGVAVGPQAAYILDNALLQSMLRPK